jgi:alkylated DNA repair dioxygenase AlkB
MTEHINTEYSSLLTHDYTEYTGLIDKCVEDVKYSLTEYPEFKIYGKKAIQHRCISFYSNESKGYTYSRKLEPSKKLTNNLSNLLMLINSNFNADFNGILINLYKSGEDYISAHSDDEKEISSTGVLSISVGAVRKFRIRDKSTRKIVKDIPTNSYSVINMTGDFQKEFLHEIPIEKKIKDIRISFTFRKHDK